MHSRKNGGDVRTAQTQERFKIDRENTGHSSATQWGAAGLVPDMVGIRDAYQGVHTEAEWPSAPPPLNPGDSPS